MGATGVWALIGHTVRQTLQPSYCSKKGRQVGVSTCQRTVPNTSCFSGTMESPGQKFVHALQRRQKSSNPKFAGSASGISGISVVTAPSRTLGPNFLVMSEPWRPSSPRPAFQATGMNSRSPSLA